MALIPVEIVNSGCSDMVGFMRVGRRIFDCMFRNYRDGKNGYTLRLQDSTYFRDRLLVIGDMLQHMRSEDEVITSVVKRELLKINIVINVFHTQVCTFISSKPLRKIFSEERLGGEVKYPQVGRAHITQDLIDDQELNSVPF